ncbi:MAG: aldose 1-epimerase family protein [Mycobacteriales bacterium]
MTFPSGRQVELRHGTQRAVVVEVGGGLRTYRLDGVDVLDGYAEDRMCDGGRGQLLIPWPNRIADGRYELAGTGYQLALTEPATGNAIHGLTRWSPWRLEQPADGRAIGSWVLHPQPGYPFRLDCTVTYRLDGAGLSVTMAVVNRADRDAPVGFGAHPYLAAGTGLVDGARLRLPASTRLVTDDRSIPRGRAPVDGSEYDFRAERAIGSTALDTAYADLDRDPDGMARVRLSRADGLQVTLWADATFSHLQVYTGETLPEPQRRRGLAVEPMSCPPNAFASGDGLRLLAPGGTLAGSWGITTG